MRVPRLPVGGKPRSNTSQRDGMRRATGEEVSYTERLFPRLNLRQSNRVGACNVVSLSEVHDKRTDQRDCHLPQLFAELSSLRVSVSSLLEVRKPGSGWVNLPLARTSSGTS